MFTPEQIDAWADGQVAAAPPINPDVARRIAGVLNLEHGFSSSTTGVGITWVGQS